MLREHPDSKATRPRGALLALPLALGACVSPPSAAPPSEEAPLPALPRFALSFEPEDARLAAELEPVLVAGAREVERWFGRPFHEPFEVLILPDRASFSASFSPEWGLGESACWMVAAGVAERLHLLSPRAWAAEACEHDAADAQHVRELLTHELVHVLHGQSNPTRDFTATVGLDWFVEGLAVLASGQLSESRRAGASEALAQGTGPARLGDAWTGKHRYGISGSLVELLELRLGRARIGEMLAATTLDELLALAGTDEARLLADWRASVLAPSAPALAR